MTEEEALLRLQAIDSGKWRAHPDLDLLETELRALADCEALDTALTGYASYRLGHILVRRAHATGDDELLLDADACFTAAARAGVFGPWPDLYRVALGLRLDQCADRTVERLRQRIDRSLHQPTQDAAVNALEALMYATGGDPSVVDGLGTPHGLGEGNFLVGHPDPLPDVRMSWELAAAEVRARAERRPELLAFLLGPAGEHLVRRPGEPWTTVRLLTLHVVAVRCRMPGATRPEVVEACDSNSHKRADRVRRRILRARRDLAGVLELDDDLQLRGAPVLGAVSEDVYRAPT